MFFQCKFWLLTAYRKSPASASTGGNPTLARMLLDMDTYSLQETKPLQGSCRRSH